MVEDAEHFIFTCLGLLGEQAKLLQSAPPKKVYHQLPNPTTNPCKFTGIMLDMCWIDDSCVRSFCIEFLSNLKSARAAKLINNQGP